MLVLNELNKVQDSLVFPEQVHNEFWRNRNIILKQVKTELNNCRIKQYSTAFLEAIPHFKEARQKVNEADKLIKKVVDKISFIIDDPARDQVAQRFIDVFKNSERFLTTTEIIEKAHQRFLTGAPPCSNNKNAIGDQINWEAILINLKDDLIIVSRDSTYVENRFLLNDEFTEKTGKKILDVSDTITHAVRLLGKEPSSEALKIEEKIKAEEKIEEKKRAMERFIAAQDLLFTCPCCGSSGQNAARCRNCGYRLGCD